MNEEDTAVEIEIEESQTIESEQTGEEENEEGTIIENNTTDEGFNVDNASEIDTLDNSSPISQNVLRYEMQNYFK